MTASNSNHTNRPCDLERDKTLSAPMSQSEILICHRFLIGSRGSVSAASRSGLLSWNTRHSEEKKPDFPLSLVKSLIRLGDVRLKHWSIGFCSSTTARKMCFSSSSFSSSSTDCSCVCHTKQSMESSFHHCHMAPCVILLWSMGVNGGWWWLVSVAASRGVWNVRLFPLNLI